MNLFLASVVGIAGLQLAEAGSISQSPSGANGDICIAPVPADASALDRETGNQRGYSSYSFAFRVDRGSWIAVPTDSPRLVGGFNLESKHVLTIREGSRQVESFWFTFAGRGGSR